MKKNIKYRKILITGGAGFIGSNLAQELSNLGHDLVIYDNLSSGNINNINGIPHEFILGDILDKQLLTNSFMGIDAVIHLAALTSVVESFDRYHDYINANTLGTSNVLDAAKRSEVKKVVYASTAAIYGDSPVLPKSEEMKPDPKSVYAITKLDGEYYCNLYSSLHELKTTIGRFFNVFGDNQNPLSAYAAAIPIFITKALKNEDITIFGDGEQTRDFVYIKDVVNSLIFMMNNSSGVYNIGYGKTITINSLVKMILDITKSESKVHHVGERVGEIKHSYSSINKLLDEGYSNTYAFDEGLIKTIQHYKLIFNDKRY